MAGDRNKWFSWPRLLCVFVSAGLLWFVCRDLDLSLVWAVLKGTNLWAFVLALIAYSVTLSLAALVWHIALAVVRCSSHVLATNRFALIGHFFFVSLFGAVGCDLAKSAVYARWYRFGLPEVLAAAPLERGLRGIGALGVGVIVVGMGLLSGGTAAFAGWRLNISPWWLVLFPLVCVVIVVLYPRLKPTGQGFIARLRRSFRAGLGQLAQRPRVAFGAIGAAILAQAGASIMFALCLAAVTNTDLPWLKMAWTFPAIVVVSCLPFTVAGTGVREVASVTMLGLYGVPAAEALACSLLSLIQKLILAAWGALAWWREEVRQKRYLQVPAPRNISVIIPTLNEEATLAPTLTSVRAIPEITQVIVADGGSTDGTCAVATQHGARVITAPRGRGSQLRAGAQLATGDVVLLLHADALLPPTAGQAILKCLNDITVVGGGLWKRYPVAAWPLWGARIKSLLRLLVFRRIYGDQAIFVRREALAQIGGVPAPPLMEESMLCRRLRKIGRLALADASVLASDRRFRKYGYLRTAWLTFKVTWLYRLGWSPEELARIYYSGDVAAGPPDNAETAPVRA